MDKKEILEKAQEEKRDEMEIFVTDRSMRWTYLVMVLSAGIFTIIRSFQDLPIMDLSATVLLSVSAGNIYRYTKTKEKYNLILGIAMAMMGIFAAVRFFWGY